MAVETVQMKVSGLMCSFCTMSVEKALKRYPAVKNVMVNLVHGIVLVEADTARINRADLAAMVEKLGYNVSATAVQQYATDVAIFALIKQRSAIGMILAVIDVLVDPLNLFGLPAQWCAYFSLVVATFILLWVGQPILKKTVLAIRQRVINANVLLSTGAWGSFIVGTFALFDPRWPNFLPLAAWLMALHLFFGYFKLDTRRKAADAVRKLLSLQPAKARVLRAERQVEVLTNEVEVGEITIVRPGERIPLDGKVVEGVASVDESSFTGESIPAIKPVGSDVIGGTLNLDGALRVCVTKVGADTFLSQIVRLMTQIADRKPPIELLADRLMNYYGPVVFMVAGVAFAGWLLATGQVIPSVLVLLTVVIMGYPCALGITTPMLAAIAGGRGISVGLLVKASEVFHALSVADTVVFDKTGTLTYGRPTVTDVVAIGAEPTELLALAGAVETPSEHPLGQAIRRYVEHVGARLPSIQNFRAIPGKGVTATVDGIEVIGGKPSFLEEHGIKIPEDAHLKIKALATEGKTVVMFASDGMLSGMFALQDTPRKGAKRAIEKLKARGMKTVMLTGDSRPVAEAIGKLLGVDEVRAELLPADKVAAIEALQKQGHRVAMVGDGINDAPALAQANVGIAIAAGTDVAIESAGVILVSDRIEDIAGAFTLGKASYRTMTGNVVVAVLFNVIGMVVAAFGWITPLYAIGFMMLSIFAILLNTLRIHAIRLRDEEEPDQVDAPVAEVELVVPQMVCEGCAEKIRETLIPIAGVQAVQPKVPQKHVIVRFNPRKIQEPQIKKALEDVGYPALEA